MGQTPTFSRYYLLFLFLLTCWQTSFSVDNAHFYRATFFFGEPRFEKNHLSSFDFIFGGGSTCKGLNCCSDETCLLNIYGPTNALALGKGVKKDLTKIEDIILHQLEALIPVDCFGQLLFKGQFNTFEAVFSWIQNIRKGFLFQAHIPIRNLRICGVSYCDLSPQDCTCPNVNYWWQAFLEKFDDILALHNLNRANVCNSGIGDVSLLVGWAKNYEDTDYIDFIDATFKLGAIVPTGALKNEDYIFSLPMGYNRHPAFTASVDLSFGLYEWVTVGGHIDVNIFANKLKCMHVKTAADQCGIIKLAKDWVCYSKGNLLNFGLYFKADHISRGFSLILGYTLSDKQEDCIIPCDKTCIDCTIANNDEMLKKWRMHTMHFIAEYDFTQEDWKFGPRASIFYNYVAGGKRIFKTGIGGGTVGLEVAWDL